MTVQIDTAQPLVPLSSPTEARVSATFRGWNPILLDACTEEVVREKYLHVDPEGEPTKRTRKKKVEATEEVPPPAPSVKLSREEIVESCRRKIPMQDGKPGIPAGYLFSALKKALMYDKRNTKVITRGKWVSLPSVLAIADEFLFFTGDPIWIVDRRSGKNGPIYRPRFNNWGFTVNFTAEQSVMTIGTIRRLFYVAGRFIGLGSFRPGLMKVGTEILELPGRAPIARTGFGQFRVANWTVDGEDRTYTESRDAAPPPVVLEDSSAVEEGNEEAAEFDAQ